MITCDIWFAAYLKFNGYVIKDFEIIQRGKAKFIFDMSQEDYKKMKLDFIKSDLSKLKQIIEEVKDLAY
jgi:hypothetical protein